MPAVRRLSPALCFGSLVAVILALDFILGITQTVFPDLVVFSLASYLGVLLVQRTGQPLWFRNPAKRWAKAVVLVVSVAAMGLNAYFTGWTSIRSHSGLPEYLLKIASTPVRGAVMALRAGITEEILFRFLLGGLIMLAVQRVTTRSPRWTQPITIVLTGLAFCLLHPNPLAAVCGAALAFVYFETGLVPAMVVHFAADLVVWGFMIPLFY